MWRKAWLLVGSCMLLAVVLTLAAQEPFDLSPVMKDIGAIQNSLRINLTNDVAVGVAADAAKLQENFTKAMGFFKAMKAQDAVDVSRANADAAGQIVKAAKANNLEAAKAAAGNIQKSCKACHDIHREQLPDKTYKFK